MNPYLNLLFDLGLSMQRSGLTRGWLVLMAFLFTLTFALSVREIALWLFRIPRLNSELSALQEQVRALEQQLSRTRVQTFEDFILSKQADAPKKSEGPISISSERVRPDSMERNLADEKKQKLQDSPRAFPLNHH